MSETSTPVVTDDGESWRQIRRADGSPAMDDDGRRLMKRARDGRVRWFDAGGEQ